MAWSHSKRSRWLGKCRRDPGQRILPRVSRAYYLAKFERTALDDNASDEFRAAAERLCKLPPTS